MPGVRRGSKWWKQILVTQHVIYSGSRTKDTYSQDRGERGRASFMFKLRQGLSQHEAGGWILAIALARL